MPFVRFVANVGNVETVLSLLSLQPWNRWYPWNRDFVEIVATVGFVGMRGTVLSLETWKWPVPAPLSASPSGLAPQSAPLAFPMRAQAALFFSVSFAAPPHARGL